MSYRRAVWPDFDHPPDDLILYWDEGLHPHEVQHQLFSDMAKFVLLQLLRNAGVAGASVCAHAPQPNYTAAMFDRWDISGQSSLPRSCAMRHSDAGLPPVSDKPPPPTEIVGNWKYEADGPQRAVGWVGRFPAGVTPTSPLSITFPVVFSDTPRLEVKILRSYENFLNASVTLSGCDMLDASSKLGTAAPPGLPGYWEKHYSLPVTIAWDASFIDGSLNDIDELHAMKCLPKAGLAHLLTITVVPPATRPPSSTEKVKIILVTSC